MNYKKLIIKFPNKHWDWRYISRNPNITIEENPDKPWDWKNISRNTFNYLKRIKICQRTFIKRYYKRKRAAQKITRMCHNWIWKPLCNDNTIGIRLCT